MCECESESESVMTDRSSNSTSFHPIDVTRPEPRDSFIHSFVFCYLLEAIANLFSSILSIFNVVVLVLVYKERVE
jgi:hypothetical protein